MEKYCTGSRKDNLSEFIKFLDEEDEVYSWPFKEPWLDIGSEHSQRLIQIDQKMV